MNTASSTTNHPKSIISPVMKWFLAGMILANLAGNMYRMYLPIYLSNELGATVTQVGMVFTLAALLPLFLQVFGGWVSDSIGRLLAIGIGSVGGIIGFFLMILAGSWQFMLVAIAIESFSQVMVAPSFGPFLADQSDPDVRGKVYGIATTLFTVVSVIGPPLGGFIANQFDIRTLLWVGAIPYTLSFFLRLGMAVYEIRRRGFIPKLEFGKLQQGIAALAEATRVGNLVPWLIITAGVVDIFTKLSRELMPLYMEQIARLNPQQIGVATAMFGIATMLFAILAGSLSDKVGEKTIISSGFIFAGVGLTVFIIAPKMIFFALAWFIFGIGNAMLGPAFSSLVSKIVPKRWLGLAFGSFWTLRGLISFPSSWIAARLWAGFEPQTPFILFVVIALIFSVISYLTLRLKTSRDKS